MRPTAHASARRLAEPLDSAARDARISHAADIVERGAAADLTPRQRERFDAMYREHFDFVFRNLRRLGVPDASVDDALQDVYLVAFRRIVEFCEGTHDKAWLFAIAVRVANNHRRGQRRRGEPLMLAEERVEAAQPGPFELAAREEARRVLHTFLETLDDTRRAVFVLSELEQLSAPEIAQSLSANLNTVYSWQRLARAEFVRFLARRTGGPAGG